jgi:hypothetical protein
MKLVFRRSSGGIGQNGAMHHRAGWPPLACTSLVVGTLLAGAAVHAGELTRITFDGVRVGTLPPGFHTLTSAESEPGRWEVERVHGVAALGQLAVGHAGYRLAVLESPRLEHLRAGVRLRMGQGDEAAGLAWRIRDVGNYYAVRLDLKQRELVLYKFVRGNRIRLSKISDLRLNDEQWHELAVEHVGDRIKVWLNGIPVATEHDAALSDPGMIGLWLPGDSTAHFTRLWYEPVRKD